jgi:hypothetical protein
MTSKLLIFITNILVPLVSLHAALKDFLYRFPTTLWLCSLLGLILILLVKLTSRNVAQAKSSSFKVALCLLIPLGLFTTFLEIGQTPTTKLQFESFHKFLSFFEEHRQRINFNSELIKQYQKAYSAPRKPNAGIPNSHIPFRVLFKEREIVIKEQSLHPSELLDICQNISILRVREIFENLKNSVNVANLTKLTYEEALSLKKICGESINYQFWLDLVSDISTIRVLQPKSHEYISKETVIYNKLSALQVKNFFSKMPQLSNIKFSFPSLLSTGSTGDINYLESSSTLNKDECKKLIVEELGMGDLIPYQAKARASKDANAVYLFYPTGMFSPLYLLDKNRKETLFLNWVNEDQNTFCFVKFKNGEVSFKVAEVEI